MLSRFNNQVLSQGANGVLPQNLNSEWLIIQQKMAEDFLDSSYDLEECKNPEDVADPILSVCVYELLRFHHGDVIDIDSGKLNNIMMFGASIAKSKIKNS